MKRTTKTVLGTSLATVAALAATQSENFANAETYTIKFGDTLSELAEQFNTTVEALRDDNQIEDINWIIAGDTLEVNTPEVEPVEPVAEVQSATTDVTEGQRTYIVQAGDTLSKIGAQFGVSVQQLQVWNGLSGDLILVGQELLVSPEKGEMTAGFANTSEALVEESHIEAAAAPEETVVEEDADEEVVETVVADDTEVVEETEEVEEEAPVEDVIVDDAEVSEEYVVQPGDSLSSIAERYNISVEKLRELNNLISDFIFSGQNLHLIATEAEEAAAQAEIDAEAEVEAQAQAEAEQAAKEETEREAAEAAARAEAQAQAEAEAQAQREAEEAAARAEAQAQAEAEAQAQREAEEAAARAEAQAQAEAEAQAQREAQEAAARAEEQARAEAEAAAAQAAAQAQQQAQQMAQPSAGGVVGTAMQYLGTGYAWGGSTPGTGFDCSGLVQYVYAQHGIQLPRTTYEQATVGQRISFDEVQPGDLYFWGDSPYHVAIAMGNGDYIHAPNPQSVVEVSNINNGWTPTFAMRL
ncbi:LysM peptidoglycan-binding domain-containing protein [Aerococcus vaginalis]